MFGPRSRISPSRPSDSRSSTPGRGKADAARAALAVVGVRDVHERLGHAVALEHLLAAALGEGAMELGGQRSGSRHAEAKPSQLADARGPREAVVHGGHAEEQAGVVAPGRVEDGVDAEARQQHGRGARQQGAVQSDAQPVGVEQRQREHEAVRRGPAPRQSDRLASGQQVGVREDRPLGAPGGPRCVTDQSRVSGRHCIEHGRLALGESDVGPGDDGLGSRRGQDPAGPIRVVTSAALGRELPTMCASSRSR